MGPVYYSEAAVMDLARIWFRIAEETAMRRADEVRTKIEESLTRVMARHPGAGRPRPEFGPDVRSFLISWPYVAFYRHTGRRVQILRVLHGRRDIREPLMSLLAAV